MAQFDAFGGHARDANMAPPPENLTATSLVNAGKPQLPEDDQVLLLLQHHLQDPMAVNQGMKEMTQATQKHHLQERLPSLA